MKIAITSRGEDLDAEMDQRFGRCQYFVIVDSETMEFQAHDNKAAMERGGAGPQAAKAILDLGAEILITGNLGPNAHMALHASGIKGFIGASGTVKEALEQYKNGELKHAEEPNVDSHAGMP